MLASQRDIKFYKGVLLIDIHRHLCHGGTFMSIEELDIFLKDYADLTFMSCSNMNYDQMQVLKELSKQFSVSIGMSVDHFDKDEIKLKF